MDNKWYEIEPQTFVELTTPYDLTGKDNFPAFSKKYPYGPIKYRIYKNAIASEHGAIISTLRTTHENFYNELMLHRYGFIRYKLSRLLRNKTIKMTGQKYLILFDVWSSANLYHFYFYTLEKLTYTLDVDALKDFKFLLPPVTSKFVEETISLLGITDFYKMEENCNLKADFVIISPGNNAVLPTKRSTISIKNLLLSKVDCSLDLGERIYISRQNAEKRKVINQKELDIILSQFNFKIVCAEDYSLAEQISIFKNAKVVVSPHGAGLSNIIFLDEESTVIEINTDNREQCVPHYMVLSNHCNLKYYYFDSSTEKDNFRIDIKEFENLLNTSLLNQTQEN